MTLEQENKELKKLLRDKKHFMENKEREGFEREIFLLKNKVEDTNKLYDLVGKYRKVYEKEKNKNRIVSEDISTLERKIDHLHKFYKNIINKKGTNER